MGTPPCDGTLVGLLVVAVVMVDVGVAPVEDVVVWFDGVLTAKFDVSSASPENRKSIRQSHGISNYQALSHTQG